MIKAFPKIFALGTKYVIDIFNEDVEISEKVDGSQFCFGKIDGELFARSKGKQLFLDNPEKMFAEAVNYVASIEDKMPDNVCFYAEYLKKPKHNTLCYDRIPKNHLMLFGAMTTDLTFIPDFSGYADLFEIEMVPIIYSGKAEPGMIEQLLSRKSVLGGADIEGVVVKNYARPFLLGGQPLPLMSGKYVSEKFKEVHGKNWSKEKTSKGKLETFFSGYRSEARWEKAVQHLRDAGKLAVEPRDIGNLIKEIQNDITEEEAESVKDFLWNNFKGELMRKATAGFPEWYKKKLLAGDLA